MKRSLVCRHLLSTPEIPCVHHITDPIADEESGHEYLCIACAMNIRNLDDADLAYICEDHVRPDAMTIERTFDVRKKEPCRMSEQSPAPFIPPRTREEIQNPAQKGQRHEQMLEVALSLLGAGLKANAVFVQLTGNVRQDCKRSRDRRLN